MLYIFILIAILLKTMKNNLFTFRYFVLILEYLVKATQKKIDNFMSRKRSIINVVVWTRWRHENVQKMWFHSNMLCVALSESKVVYRSA